MFSRLLEPRTGRTTADVIRYAMWPLAIMTVLHRVIVKAVDGSITDDFRPVYNAALAFLNNRPVYTADFGSVDPHYLYPPSGTLLMAPLAVIDPERSRWLFIGANAIAVLVGLYLLLRLFDLTLSSIAAPILVFAAFSSETVTNTLIFTNINGLIFLAEMVFLLLLLRRRDLWAGAALGVTFAIKPVLAPLLLLPLVRGQWKVLVTAVGIPLVLNVVAWPLSADPMDYIRRTMPYVGEARDYYNSSIAGNGLYFGLPDPLIWFFRIVLGILVLVALWLLWRYYREDEVFFVVTAGGLLLVASWLLGSLGQMYYSMLLFPLVMSVVLKNSVMRNWPAWLAVYGFLTFDNWWVHRFNEVGRNIEYTKTTLAWSLLIVVVAGVLVSRYLVARKEGRLESGIDPAWLSPAATRDPDERTETSVR